MRWLLLLAIFIATHAAAAPRLSLAEMADGAEYIVEGTVLRSWTAWDAPHQFLWTHYVVSVSEWLKAPVASNRIVIVSEPARLADSLPTPAESTTPYTVGEKVVVLAWRTPEGFLRAAGNGQGKFTVAGFAGPPDCRLRWSPQVVNMLRDAREPYEHLDNMRLNDFRIYVRRFVRFTGERRAAK